MNPHFEQSSELRARVTAMRAGVLLLALCTSTVQAFAQTQLPDEIHTAARSVLQKLGSTEDIRDFKQVRNGMWSLTTQVGTLYFDAYSSRLSAFVATNVGNRLDVKSDQAALAAATEWMNLLDIPIPQHLSVERGDEQTWHVVSDEAFINGVSASGLRKLSITVHQKMGVFAMTRSPEYTFPDPTPAVTPSQAAIQAERRALEVLGKPLKAAGTPNLSYAPPNMMTSEWTSPGFTIRPDSRIAALVYLVKLEDDTAVTVDANTGLVWNGEFAKSSNPKARAGERAKQPSKTAVAAPTDTTAPLIIGSVVGVVILGGFLLRKR